VQTGRLHESFEGSYNSVASSSGELSWVIASYCSRQWETDSFFIFGVKWGFWAIILVPDMLEGQASALSTRETIMCIPKFWPIELASKVRKNWSKNQKHPHFPSLSHANH